ncbi:hypothetical protein [Fulvivirga sedimenti]|uniref:Uncharacterized protein n=1 Tax=Fulvivirga sedimenti TaxID=2879465 RepID=A0A9X1HVH2_9BACT|nr:hypothetical protein [Fulvivirga sedimenti]MCA6078636.1 hypothetical protein [Fulvivirga sedimenti]
MSAGFIRCSEEEVRSSYDTPLKGLWQISWAFDNEILTGSIEFRDNEALIQAYGSPDSHLLSGFDEARFIVVLSEEKVTLKNHLSGIELVYEIQHREPDYWELSYLDEITVVLAKK